MFYFRAAHEKHNEHGKTHAHRNRHIRLRNDKHAHTSANRKDRQKRAETRHFPVIFRHIRRRKHDKPELGDFTCLNCKKRQVYPAFRAVVLHAYMRHEYEYEHQVRYRKQRIAQFYKNAIVDKRASRHRSKPESRADSLFYKKIILVAVSVFRRVRTCRIHHQYTE